MVKQKKPKKLKKEKLNYYKKILEKQREILIHQLQHLGDDALNNIKESSGDLSSHTLHMADLATDNYNRDFSIDLVNNEENLLRRIDDALKRIKDGTYGYCLECEKKLPEKRLKAMPYAELCIEHQEEKEKDMS
jgi:RNA polymerase-binding protein DksA